MSYRIGVNSVITPTQLYKYNTTSDALSFNVTGKEVQMITVYIKLCVL